MKTNLSLTVLALFATSLMLPMQANAAERQISVNPKLSKIQSFTVDKDEQQAVEVAATNPDEPRQKVTPKAFRVDEKPVVIEEASDETNVDAPKLKPRKKNTLRFRVEDQSEQASAAPTQDDDQDVASSQEDRPAILLKDRVKLSKNAPAVTEDEPTTDDADHSADIAADTSAPEEETLADTTEEPVAEPVIRNKHRVYYYASKQKFYDQYQQDDYASAQSSYVQDDYAYQQAYTGSSCHQNNNY